MLPLKQPLQKGERISFAARMGNNNIQKIICQGEELILSPLRAAFWPKHEMLILADMHLGKSGYFRANGIQIPSTVMGDDLNRLTLLIDMFQPKKILVAGDMFHHNYNVDINNFRQWRQDFEQVDFLLVPGNHDRLLKIDYETLNIQLTGTFFQLYPFLFTHEMAEKNAALFTVSGHLHPGYVLAGRARQYLRLPCFIQSANHLLLPAFSAFTGLFTGYTREADHKYLVIAGDEIFKV